LICADFTRGLIEIHNMIEEKIQITDNETVDLRALARLLWTGRSLILSITGLFTAISLVYALLATPYYLSTLTIYPATGDTGTLGQLQNLASTFGMSVGRTEETYNIMDVVRSRRVRKAILGRTWQTERYATPVDLVYYWEINDTTAFSLNPLTWAAALFGKSSGVDEDLYREWEEEALERLKDLISVSEDRNTGLIRIGMLMEEPQLAADIANYIALAVTDYIQAKNTFEASRNRRFIQERLEVGGGELERGETDLKDFREANRRIADSPELQMEEGRLIRQVEVKQQVYITLQQQLELSRIEEVKQTPVIHTLDEAEPAIEKEKPNRKAIVLLFLMSGLMVGMIARVVQFKLAT